MGDFLTATFAVVVLRAASLLLLFLLFGGMFSGAQPDT